MNCFYHPGVSAVGICKSCGKGICPECAHDLVRGLACRGKCENDVADLIALINRNVVNSPSYERILKTGQKNRFLGAIFYLVFGLFFLGFGGFHVLTQGFESDDVLTMGMGAIFLIFGLFFLSRAQKYPVISSSSQTNKS